MNAKKKTMITTIASIYILAALFGLTNLAFKINNQTLIPGLVYYLLMISILIYIVKIVEKKDFKSIGLDCGNLPMQIALGIGIFAVLSLFTLGFYLTGTKFDLSHRALGDVIPRTLYFIFIIGVVEELVFRGYIQGRLSELSGSGFIPVILTSLIFALWHYPTNFRFGQVIFTFFLGLVLSFIRYKSKKNIIFSLALAHGLYNSTYLWIGFIF